MAAAKVQPIIVIKKKGGHGGHHGGAWKVAYADFVTAMMALFIVLWLTSQSDPVKKAVAGYFNDPKGTANLLGTTMSGNGVAVTTHDEALQKLKDKLEQEIQAKKELEKLSKQIEITITPEGLRIELLEGKDGTFYESGSAKLSGNGQELLALLAGELKTLPNDLLIEGHTDATQYSTDASYSNWELSADRANSARRLMQQDGVRGDQVTQVRGYADQLLRVKNNPYDPSNRRISILVRNAANGAPPQIKDAKTVGATGGAPISGGQKSEAGGAGTQTKPASEAAAPQVAQKPSTSTPAANQQPAKSGLMSKIMGLLPGKKKCVMRVWRMQGDSDFRQRQPQVLIRGVLWTREFVPPQVSRSRPVHPRQVVEIAQAQSWFTSSRCADQTAFCDRYLACRYNRPVCRS